MEQSVQSLVKGHIPADKATAEQEPCYPEAPSRHCELLRFPWPPARQPDREAGWEEAAFTRSAADPQTLRPELPHHKLP